MDVTTETFERDVVERSRELPVVADSGRPGGPCRTLGPAIEGEVEKRTGKLELVKIDIDAEQALAARFGIQSIPTVAVFRDGEPVTGSSAPTRRRPSASSSTRCSPRRPRRPRRDSQPPLLVYAEAAGESADYSTTPLAKEESGSRQCEGSVLWMRHAPPEPATTSASSPSTSEAGRTATTGIPLLQVKAATVSSRKTPASAQAKNRITRSDTIACCHNPTRARTTNTAATSSSATTAPTTRTPVAE